MKTRFVCASILLLFGCADLRHNQSDAPPKEPKTSVSKGVQLVHQYVEISIRDEKFFLVEEGGVKIIEHGNIEEADRFEKIYPQLQCIVPSGLKIKVCNSESCDKFYMLEEGWYVFKGAAK